MATSKRRKAAKPAPSGKAIASRPSTKKPAAKSAKTAKPTARKSAAAGKAKGIKAVGKKSAAKPARRAAGLKPYVSPATVKKGTAKRVKEKVQGRQGKVAAKMP